MGNRPDTPVTFCDCQTPADCAYGLTDIQFAMCRGTGPQSRREDYRRLVRGERSGTPLRQSPPSIDELEAMSDDEFEQHFGGCSGCGS